MFTLFIYYFESGCVCLCGTSYTRSVIASVVIEVRSARADLFVANDPGDIVFGSVRDVN